MSDSASHEIMRVWIAEGGQHFSVRIGTWDDPAAWGLLLADLARHIAASHASEYSADKEATLERIADGWNAEIGFPTNPPR